MLSVEIKQSTMSELKKDLTLWGLTMIAIGATIGSGIFLTPSKIAAYLMHPTFVLGIWVLVGIIALCGALTFAELGGLFPRAGGIYTYLREGYGELTAFLYGWVILTVINTGSIAAVAAAFARYFNYLIPVGDNGLTLLAVAAIIVVTIINIYGVKVAELFSNIFTGLKVLGISIIILIGIFWGLQAFPNLSLASGKQPVDITTAFALALTSVLWSYGGWQHASYLAGETKNATRNVPLAMIIGASIVTIVYVLTNIAYLKMLPVETLAHSKAVAADAIATVFPSGGKAVAMLIAISTFGTVGIYVMSAPRIYFAMAKDKVFFKQLANLHPKYQTPVTAIVVQSAWSIFLLLFWNTFENLIDYVVFTEWIFMFLAAVSVFIFRKKMKTVHRPYKTLFYPIPPIMFALITTWFIANSLFNKPVQAIAGLILLAIGIPIFMYFKKNNAPSNN